MSEQEIIANLLTEQDVNLVKKLIALLPIALVYKEENLFSPNQATLKLLGYESTEIITLTDWQEKICAANNYKIENGTSQTLVLIKKDNSHCFSSLTIYKQANFEIWLLQDISYYLRIEQIAKDNEIQMTSIVDSAMDGIISVNREQNILVFNKAAEDIFGYRAEEVIGKPLNLLIPHRFHQTHHKHIHKFEKTGVSTRRMGHLGTITGLKANGEEFPIEASISQVKIQGQMIYTVILRDITERLRLEEELKQAQEEKLARKQEQLLESYKKADQIFSALVEILPNTVLDGKYRLETKIGKGGYGVVYRATHLALNRLVAVKIFRPIAANESQENLSRFRLEGISTCRVNHINAVSILDSGVSLEGIVYLVMELLEGHSLAVELEESKTLSVKRCLEILIPTCNVLAEAHRAGVIHRDIKPDNIFLHKSGDTEIVKVVDFGIAKFLDQSSGMIDLQNLTVQGIILGTPIYMAPERLSNSFYDGRSDVYSLGIMFYQMLCGHPPFEIGLGGIFSVAISHISEKPQMLTSIDADIPLAIEDIVMRTLSKEAVYRPSAEELSQELQKLLQSLSEKELNYNHNLKHKSRTSSTTTETLVI
ncbi:MAG: protein kinase [Blastocatellia bacterium]|nr:protein kinase [Blastocatellia bacterium]